MATTKITTPELFDFSATNTALQLPTGTTAQRPTSPSAGEWRFNTTEKYVEYWDGGSPGAWKQIDTEAPVVPVVASENFNVNTYFGNGATQAIDAKFNEAANFNGASSGSQIFISDADVFSPANNDLSFSVWVKTSSTSGGYFASKQDDSTLTYEWQFYMNTNGTVALGVFTSTGTTIAVATSTAIVNNGNWHNVAFVIDTNSSITVYVDKAGVTNSSWSGTMSNTSTDVLLGAGGGVPSFRLQGMLDQARFFNTALSSSQIDSLYDSETTTTAATLDFPVGAGCFAAYQLDGDASDVGGTYGGVTTDIGYTGLKFEPDFVWAKRRSATEDNVLFDSVRGVQNQIVSNKTDAESTKTNALSSFDSNGFTTGANNALNTSGQTYVAWCFKAGGAPTATNSAGAGNVPTAGSVKIDGADLSTALAGTTAATKISANTKAGFSIVQFSGNLNSSGNIQVGHGLSSPPELIIQKNTQATGTWWARPFFLNNNPYQYLGLSESASLVTSSSSDGTMAVPTSTTFDNNWNTSLGSATGVPVIAYCFHSVADYQKVGSYLGTGNANGEVVNTEFEPSFLMVKGTDVAGTWAIFDNKRNTSNPRDTILQPNTSDADSTSSTYNVNFYTNGFQFTGSNNDVNMSGKTYIYLAIAADKDSSVPTQANSFKTSLYTGNGGTQNIYTPFAPDFTWLKERSGTQWHSLYDSIRGIGNRIVSNSSNAQNNDPNRLTSFNPNGFSIGTDGDTNTLNDTYVSWNWKAGGLPTINSDGTNITSIVTANQAAGFSIVKYKGIGSTASVGHGLGVVPKLIIAKCLDITSSWVVYSETTGIDKFIELNDSPAAYTASGYWGSSAPTTSVFEVNNGNSNNNSTGNNIIAYCFADIPSYQQVGSYTWTGTSYTAGTLVTGLNFTPRFVMIKGTDVDSNWMLYDNQRVSGTQSFRLAANISAAEDQVGYQGIIIDSDGFSAGAGADGNVTGSDGLNKNGKTYIYLAIA